MILRGSEIIVGVDEAGRGCLAGSVYAGAVILTPGVDTEDIRDSKKISESRREAIFNRIIKEHQVGIGFATVEEITQNNILNAAFLAMRRAIENLGLSFEEKQRVHVRVDGSMTIRGLTGVQQTAIIKGDQKDKAIAAASIVAKVSRDREIRKLSEDYPAYGFLENKGYGTELHRRAIEEHGPSPIHRPTFAGVREFLRSQ